MAKHLGARALSWTSDHRGLGLDLVRIFLGVALFVRGALMIGDPALFGTQVADADPSWFVPAAIGHYVIPAHFVGGGLLAVGLTTRLAAIAQLPALVGAVFFVHLRAGLMTAAQSLELSALVLFLLVVFGVFGSGRLSLDHHVFGEPARRARTRREDRRVNVTDGVSDGQAGW